MAGINAEAEQREQLIAETEQRITDLKQQIEKARDILVVHQWQVCLMHNLIRGVVLKFFSASQESMRSI